MRDSRSWNNLLSGGRRSLLALQKCVEPKLMIFEGISFFWDANCVKYEHFCFETRLPIFCVRVRTSIRAIILSKTNIRKHAYIERGGGGGTFLRPDIPSSENLNSFPGHLNSYVCTIQIPITQYGNFKNLPSL